MFQKLAFYSKMQEAQESISGGSSFSNLAGPTIKEEDCAREKDHPPEAEYLNSRCVLFTYFQGDISSVVDEHFSRALNQPTSYVPGSVSNKSARGRLTSTSRRGADHRTTPNTCSRAGFQFTSKTVYLGYIEDKGNVFINICIHLASRPRSCMQVSSWFLVYYCVHILLK